MPAFVAINVEPEDNVEDEVDVTRRIQTDDALKLYQTALKYHAQGPRSFREAEKAYALLFQSEIFKYPDARTEYERTERQPGSLSSAPTFSSGLGLETAVIEDNASESSLPQAYYLAYKNHGQFLLDRIRHKARVRAAQAVQDAQAEEKDAEAPGDVFEETAVQEDAREALNDFDAALDRDPSDAELWRRSARVAAFLQSVRIERYCLEAAIEVDDDPAVVEVEPPSLAEGFAGEQLRSQLQALADDIALSHPIMAPFLRKQMAASLHRYMDPMPWLPNPTRGIAVPKTSPSSASSGQKAATSRMVLKFTSPSWADLGMAMVQCVDEFGISGRAVVIEAPDMPDDNQIMQIEIDQQLQEIVAAPGGDANERKNEAEKDDVAVGTTADDSTEDKAVEKEVPREAAKEGQKEAKEVKEAKERSTSQSRKRSQSAAGLPDAGEEDNGDTKRSKRIRRRETLAEETMDASTAYADHLGPLKERDHELFVLLQTEMAKLGVPAIAELEELIAATEATEEGASEEQRMQLRGHASKEMLDALVSYKDERAKILLSKKATPVLGLDAFLEHTRASQQQARAQAPLDELRGLPSFVQGINSGWFTLQEVAYQWVMFLSMSYTTLIWSEAMKRAVVQVLNRLDEAIYERVQHELLASPGGCGCSGVSPLHELVQMLFELYLDVYERITNPSSAVDQAVRLEIRYRLDRWMDVASGLARALPGEAGKAAADLKRRFLWACVFSTTLGEAVSREHTLACWESLRQWLEEGGSSNNGDDGNDGAVKILLPNNVVMPEVSQAAAEGEISKLTTKDFFMALFQEQVKDPVAVIHRLEPVLNPSSVCVRAAEATEAKPVAEVASAELRDLWKFVRGSNTHLRFFLWSRLADAYRDIGYPSKVLSCQLRSIEMMVADLGADATAATTTTASEAKRQQVFVHLLKTLDETTSQALSMLGAQDQDGSVFDIVDEAHLQASLGALVRLCCILHVASVYEDEVHAGLRTAAASSQTYHAFVNKLHEMQMRAWTLLAMVAKEGMEEKTEGEEEKEEKEKEEKEKEEEEKEKEEEDEKRDNPPLARLLRAIHEAMGPRKHCKAANKMFLRMARSELLRMGDLPHWADQVGQVLYDLHGLKLGVGATEVQDHGCPVERLERQDALALVDKVAALARGLPMKELLKSDLKNTVEHMQQAIGQTKSTTQMIHNLRYFTEYLKRPIHPLRLFEAWRGGVALDAVPATTATTADAVLARSGWFFLLGMVALTKFKGVDLNRRQTPGATDDLRVGAQYLRLQLQLTPARWDAWFRLAECADYDLDETVLWSAEKMNKDRGELVKLQRSAVHCYTLALSYWRAGADALSGANVDALHDLYHNFGLRMYASTREPFAMEAFRHAAHERWFIAPDTLSTYKRRQHGEMTDYMAWKYAAGLFRRALALAGRGSRYYHKDKGERGRWRSAYMLAKCLWKMHCKPAADLPASARDAQPTVDDVIAALETSIRLVMQLPKPRHGQDPVLEPHYKMLSIVDKLVRRGALGRQVGADLLQRQPYALRGGEPVAVAADDAAAWDDFVVQSLRHLRDKDKSNWQHRMMMRHAWILFGEADRPEPGRPEPGRPEGPEGPDGPDGPDGQDGQDRPDGQDKTENSNEKAKAAFNVLRESMFTKTMVMNVWKCDAERPGRHHVYTEQYVRFMTRLLVVLADRANLEALLRRIRKKGADFYHFNDLWQTCVISYLRLLRRSYAIPSAVDDVFKTVSPDEFEILSERITEWVGQPASDHPALSAMREAIEIKKLNGNLMKAGPIDDLISDCYSVIFAQVSPTLPGDAPAVIIEGRLRQKEAAERAERAEKEREAEAEAAAASSTAAIMLTFNLLSDKTGGGAGDRDSAAGTSRAGSEAPGTHLAAEKMERQGSGIANGASGGGGGDHPVRRGRAPGVRRPDVLRKAEQAIVRLGDSVTKAAAAAAGAAGSNGNGNGSHAAAGTSSAGAAGGRRSTRLGSLSSAKNEGGGPDGEGAAGDGEGPTGDGDEAETTRGRDRRSRARSTRSKSRRPSIGRDEAEADTDMKEAEGEGEGEGDGEGDGDATGDGDGDVTLAAADTEAPPSEASSPLGSVHDSADDESELSDVPADYEDHVPPSLFPAGATPDADRDDVDMVEPEADK